MPGPTVDSSAMLFVRAVSATRRPRSPAARSVAAVALLFPRVAVVVVAVVLPETRLVLGAQLEAAHPLGALPEIKVRDEQPGRATVLRVERLAPVFIGDPRLAAGQICKRQIGCVAAVTEREYVLGARLDVLEQRIERDA